MSNKFNNFYLKTLDNHIKKIQFCERPPKGWISAVRRALGMSTRQLAKRIGVTQQLVSKLEKNEQDDLITLKSLRKVASAMDCRLVYAIIPNSITLSDMLEKQAYIKAKNIVSSVHHTMVLEAQDVDNKDEKIKEIAKELVNNLNNKLWD
jgi:predicted DNA-binding mobile mystery protein A